MKEEKLLLALNDMEEEDLMDALSEHPYSAKRFRPGVILAAALLVGTLALSAAAMSENGWFQLFFSREKGQALTQGQVALIQTSTKTYGQSVTKDGYTVTLESVIADPENCYMNLRITGPVGTCMNNEAGYGSRSPRSPKELYQPFAPVSGAVFSGVGSWQNLEDEDPDDNQVSILYAAGFRQRSEFRDGENLASDHPGSGRMGKRRTGHRACPWGYLL